MNYPPPPAEVFNGLLLTPLFEVRVGAYNAFLLFDNNNSINLSAPFQFAPSNEIHAAPLEDFPLRSCDLVRLIGSHVTGFQHEDSEKLNVTFSNGYTILVHCHNNYYESYILKVAGKTYIV